MTTHHSGVDSQATEAAKGQEHNPARPETVVAYVHDQMLATAKALPPHAKEVATQLRRTAGGLSRQLETLGSAVNQAAAGVGDVYKGVRHAAHKSIDRAGETRARSIGYSFAGESADVQVETLSSFSARVQAQLVDRGIPLDNGPTKDVVERAYNEAKVQILGNVGADVDRLLTEAAAGLRSTSAIAEVRNRVLSEAAQEYFARAMSALTAIRTQLGVSTSMGATAAGSPVEQGPTGTSIHRALISAQLLHEVRLGETHLQQLANGKRFLESIGLLAPETQISAAVAAIIRSYPSRLQNELGNVIRKWLPEVPKVTAGDSQASLVVGIARAALERDGVAGRDLIDKLKKRAAFQLHFDILGTEGPFREAMAIIANIEEDLRRKGKL